MDVAQAVPVTLQQAVDYSIEVRTTLQITTADARQRASRFLLENLGNMITAGQPMLHLRATRYVGKCRCSTACLVMAHWARSAS